MCNKCPFQSILTIYPEPWQAWRWSFSYVSLALNWSTVSANINAKIIVNVMPPGKRIFHSILCVSVCDLCMMLQSLYPTSSLCYQLSCNHSFPSIMESHANEYELKHLQFHSCLILSFSFFFLFFISWQWQNFLQLLVGCHKARAATLWASYAEKVTSPDDSFHCPSAAPLTLI